MVDLLFVNYFLYHILLCKVLFFVESLSAMAKRAEFPAIFADIQHCPTCRVLSFLTLIVKTNVMYTIMKTFGECFLEREKYVTIYTKYTKYFKLIVLSHIIPNSQIKKHNKF